MVRLIKLLAVGLSCLALSFAAQAGEKPVLFDTPTFCVYRGKSFADGANV